MSNAEIRTYAMERGVRLWEIAVNLGITDSTFSKRLRSEFSREEKERVKGIIRKIAERK